jgi:hypothetical protein
MSLASGLDLHPHDLRVSLHEPILTCSVAAKPICAFCIATIVCSRLTVGLSSVTSRCICAASVCDLLTAVIAWPSAF